MTLTQEFAAAQDTTFIDRVLVAGVAFAINVVQSEDSLTGNHQNRATYARDFVSRPMTLAPALAQGVIALNAVADGATLTDTVVNNSVAAIWNIFAGIV